MANVLAAIAGAAAGVGNAIQQQREYNMQQVLMKAKLAELGATPNASSASAPDPNDPNPAGGTGGAGNGPSNPAAALMSGNAVPGVSAPPTPASGPLAGGGNTTQAGTVGSMVPPDAGPQTGNATQSGVSQVPTDQSSVISQARAAAGGMSGGSASGASGGGVLAALSAGKAATAAPGMSGTPTPADPVGGINSGLTGAVNDYVGAMRPTGKVDLGNGMTMPASIPPQQAQMLTALFEARKAAALQQSQQGFLGTEAEKQRTFETGSQQAQFTQQSQLAAQRDQLERDLGKANNAVQYASIAAQIKRADAEMAMLGQGKADAETQKVTADLKPMEDQLPTIAKFQAITPEMAKNNPAAVQQALLEALQTGVGGATFPSRLAKLAKAAPGEGITQVATRFAQGLANGTIPMDQFQGVQEQVQSNKDALRQQHNRVLTQDLAQYPMAAANPALRNRTDALFGPAGSGFSMPEPKASSYPATDDGYRTYLQSHAAWQTAQTTQHKPAQ